MENISSFKSLFEKAAYGSHYAKAFDDFLTMCICCFSFNLETKLSNYEVEYLRIIEPYKANNTLKYFPELLAEMVVYMEENMNNAQGNYLLGEFFQQEVTHGRNGQFFTPFHVTDMIAQMVKDEETESLNVLDPACGSGRMLLAFGKQSSIPHNYFGIDIDPLCTKMTAINLFLNGLRGEVICANALIPDNFYFGYRISFLPLGIFKIEMKEGSVIWHMNQTTFSDLKREKPIDDSKSLQLRLF